MRVRIPLAELELSYARSSGPGGQNVNKVNSKAVLRWNLLTSPSISGDLRALLLSRLAGRLSGDGDLVVASDKFRDQPRNREDCIAKLHAIVEAAAFVPKKRKKTKPSRGSRERLQQSKSRHSEKKKLRGKGYD